MLFIRKLMIRILHCPIIIIWISVQNPSPCPDVTVYVWFLGQIPVFSLFKQNYRVPWKYNYGHGFVNVCIFKKLLNHPFYEIVFFVLVFLLIKNIYKHSQSPLSYKEHLLSKLIYFQLNLLVFLQNLMYFLKILLTS